MTFVGPFDGSELSEAALVSAREFAEVLDERIVATTVVPEGDPEYAHERGWIAPEESIDRRTIVRGLHDR